MTQERAWRVGVLGGGALGLAASLRLAEAGCRVTLIEREPRLGGLAAGFQVGASSLETFYHHIFTTDRVIIQTIRALGLQDRLVWRQPDTSTFHHGTITRLSTIPSLLRLPLLPLPDRVRFLAGMAVLKAIPNEKPFAGHTASRWMRRLMGDSVYRVMWEPVLRGKFGDRAEEIAMSWLWSRVHERSLRLGYLRGGFQQMYDALGERVAALGGDVRRGQAAAEIHVEDGVVQVRTADRTQFAFDQVLSTLPTRLFTRLAPQLPARFTARYPGPDHYGAHVAILALNQPLMERVYWLNVNDRDLPFLAVVEHTNLMPTEDYGGAHLVYLGNYLRMDHPLFRLPDEEVLRQFYAALPRIQPRFQPSWVQQAWVRQAPYAQPIVTTDYLRTLPPHRTPLPGVYLANMAHVYPQDRGQNYSLQLGARVADLMLADRPASSHTRQQSASRRSGSRVP